MDVHVRQGGGQQLGHLESLVELRAATDLPHERFRNLVVGAVVQRILFQHLGFGGPVLHHLRRQLHEIALDVGQPAVLHLAEQAVQRMAEFMEEGLRLVEIEQRRRRTGRTGVVGHHPYDGRHALAVLVILFGKVPAPRSAALALAHVVVEVEHAQMALVLVEHFVDQAVGIVERCDDRPEGDTVEPVGQKEDAALHVFEREIGAQRLVVERVVAAAHLLGIVPPVPRLEGRIGVVGAQHLFHSRQLLLRPIERRRPYLVQQRIDRSGRRGHLVGSHVVGEGIVPQQVRLLGAQTDVVVHQRLVVVFVAMVAAVEVGGVELLAQFAVLGIAQEGQHTGFVEREKIGFVAESRSLRLLPRRFAHGVGQPLQAVGRQLQPERIVLVEQVVAVLHRQPRQIAVDLFEPALARLVQQGARPDEPAVELLRQPPLLGRERQRLAPVVDSLDPPEQPFVHADLVGMGRQQRHRLLLDGLHFGRRVRSGQHLEDQRRALQHPPRGIVGRDRILEGRFVRRVDDRVDLGVMERHPPLEGRQEMFGPYPVERRYAVGRRPLLEKGVGRFDLLFLTGGKRHNNKIN